MSPDLTSLPLRERGLKFPRQLDNACFLVSLPLRERGLKFYILDRCTIGCCVAPLAGAWIEISINPFSASYHSVAPLAGAWIEILPSVNPELMPGSLPLRERGLK